MPRYKVRVVEEWYVEREVEVEARDEDDARDAAKEAVREMSTTIDELEMFDLRVDDTKEVTRE